MFCRRLKRCEVIFLTEMMSIFLVICLLTFFCHSFDRTQPPPSLKQVNREAGVTVVFHVLLASNFKMTEESLFIRAHGVDLGDFGLNCVDMIAAE